MSKTIFNLESCFSTKLPFTKMSPMITSIPSTFSKVYKFFCINFWRRCDTKIRLKLLNVSTQLRTLPFRFITGTICAHHFVGWVTFSMILISSILFNSAFTSGTTGNGIRRAIVILYGGASSFSCIITGSQRNFPISPNISCLISSARITSAIYVAAARIGFFRQHNIWKQWFYHEIDIRYQSVQCILNVRLGCQVAI